MSRTITLKMLEEVEACPDQVVLFKKLFGDSTPVTEELCVKYASDFDFDFAAEKFLTEAALGKYEKVSIVSWKECEKVSAAAWSLYRRVRDAALNEYEKAEDVVWKEYRKVIDAAFNEYKKTKAATCLEYRKTIALTFCRLYNSEKE